MVAGLLAPVGCEQKPADRTPGKVTSADVRRDADQAVKTAEQYSQQTKDEFQKKLGAQLDELDAKIVELRAKGSGLKDKAKANWDQKMAELETKRKTANAKLAEVRAASAEAWKDVQKGAQAAYDDLDNAFRDAWKKF
jgi:hypothetical protein